VEEQNRLIREEIEELLDQGRRDAFRLRIHLYAIAPAGFLLAIFGTWLLTASPRKRDRP
jgi:hypothetical protein